MPANGQAIRRRRQHTGWRVASFAFEMSFMRAIELMMKASATATLPGGDLIRLVQQIDPATHARGAEKTRDSQDCDEVGDAE